MPSQVDQEKYEAVREAVIAACPEIMELSFGCRISNGKSSQLVNYLDPNGIHWCDGTFSVNEAIKNLKIIGHPIRIAHVLRAIKEKCPSKIAEGIEGINWDEGEEQYARYGLRMLREWNLLEDDLSKQSAETINFLWEILCKI